MKLKVEDKLEPIKPFQINDQGHKLWANTDSSNRIINLTLETPDGHRLVEVKNGKLVKALKDIHDKK